MKTITDYEDQLLNIEAAIKQTESTIATLENTLKNGDFFSTKRSAEAFTTKSLELSQQKELLKSLKERYRQAKGNKTNFEKGLKQDKEAYKEAEQAYLKELETFQNAITTALEAVQNIKITHELKRAFLDMDNAWNIYRKKMDMSPMMRPEAPHVIELKDDALKAITRCMEGISLYD